MKKKEPNLRWFTCIAQCSDEDVPLLEYIIEARSPREAAKLFEEVKAGDDELIRVEGGHYSYVN